MNADPRASLIVPVHDCEPYLPRLLGSIDAQTSRDFEVIFIDDCSTDASAKILAEYAAKTADIGVRALSTAESPAPADGNGPRGPSAARNIGIDAARGEYLMFLDGDDFMEPALVERALGRADETGADIVIWDLWFYNDVLERIQYPYVGTLTFEYFAGKDVFCYRDNPDRIFTSFQNWVWNKMFRADMVRREGLRFDEGLHRTEDAPFTCVALARAERIALMYERLSNYRILASKPSLMGSVSARPLDFVNAFLLLRSQLEERGLFDETRRSFVNWCAGGIVSNLDALSPYGVFLMLYRRLQAGGLDELGLTADLPEGYYFDPESRRTVDAVRTMTPEEYLVMRLQESRHTVQLRDGEVRAEIWDREDAEARAHGLEEELAHRDGELKRSRAEGAALRDEAARLRASTSYRLGNAIARPAAAVRDAIRPKKNL